MNYYCYDDVPEIRTIKKECCKSHTMCIEMVNILNDTYRKGIFGLDKFKESENKDLHIGSIVKIKDGLYPDKWGIITNIEIKEYPKILPSHKLSKNKTELATTYYIAMPCGFNDDAYSCEKFGPSKECRIIPMDVPFTVDTIKSYEEGVRMKEEEEWEEEMDSQITISKREWLDLVHKVEELEEEIKYCVKHRNYEEY